jgi:hypothetical protein
MFELVKQAIALGLIQQKAKSVLSQTIIEFIVV